MQKNNSSITNKLSGIASLVAILVGVGVLLSGWGVSLPLGLAL